MTNTKNAKRRKMPHISEFAKTLGVVRKTVWQRLRKNDPDTWEKYEKFLTKTAETKRAQIARAEAAKQRIEQCYQTSTTL